MVVVFEGLGLGSRLAFLPLPPRLNWVPLSGGVIYAMITPLGMAIGLGIRNTYHADSRAALIVAGILDSLSAGILLYTGLVELLAHEFVSLSHLLTG
jgi:zinc transporter 1/2/3